MPNNIIPNNPKFEYKTPVTVLKHTEKDIWFEKRHMITNHSVFKSEEVNGRSVVTEDTTQTQLVGYKPRVTFIIVFVLCFCFVGVFLYYQQNITDATTEVAYEEVEQIVYVEDALNRVIASGELHDGKVFSNSSFEKITDEQLERLKLAYDTEMYAMMLRISINSIYAERGYVFGNEMWKTYFSNTSWYVPAHGHDVNYSCFNSIEQYNVDKLVKAEREIRR